MPIKHESTKNALDNIVIVPISTNEYVVYPKAAYNAERYIVLRYVSDKGFEWNTYKRGEITRLCSYPDLGQCFAAISLDCES